MADIFLKMLLLSDDYCNAAHPMQKWVSIRVLKTATLKILENSEKVSVKEYFYNTTF